MASNVAKALSSKQYSHLLSDVSLGLKKGSQKINLVTAIFGESWQMWQFLPERPMWSLTKKDALQRERCARRLYLPVMAILADHLDVPSRTLCFTAFWWPAWLLTSTLNTSLKRHHTKVHKGLYRCTTVCNRTAITNILSTLATHSLKRRAKGPSFENPRRAGAVKMCQIHLRNVYTAFHIVKVACT